jgi:RNA polymerase sigma factor (sigma-70 family)
LDQVEAVSLPVTASEPARTTLPVERQESDGFGAALAREAEPLRRWLRQLAGTHAAEDLAQEALTRAWTYRQTRDALKPIGPWLRRIAFRVFLDARQRELKRREATEHDFAATAAAAPVTAAAESASELEAHLSTLASHEREVLVRFHQRGESIERIAHDLRRPVGTIKSWLHRARAKLIARVEKLR